jgi:hypothetical protein
MILAASCETMGGHPPAKASGSQRGRDGWLGRGRACRDSPIWLTAAESGVSNRGARILAQRPAHPSPGEDDMNRTLLSIVSALIVCGETGSVFAQTGRRSGSTSPKLGTRVR